jgi:hypothetical protein
MNGVFAQLAAIVRIGNTGNHHVNNSQTQGSR